MPEMPNATSRFEASERKVVVVELPGPNGNVKPRVMVLADSNVDQSKLPSPRRANPSVTCHNTPKLAG